MRRDNKGSEVDMKMGVSFDPVAFFERRIEAVCKAGSVDEYRRIVDELYECIKEFQMENIELNNKLEQLEDIEKLKKDLVRHEKSTYVTLKDDKCNLKFCSRCWDKNKDLIQMMHCGERDYKCPECNHVTNRLLSR